MNVYLLSRNGRKGKSSYYLLYVNGKFRKTESLNLKYFNNPKDHIQRSHNKTIHSLAKTIHSQRIIDCQYTSHGMISPARGKISLLSFFDKVMETKQNSNGTYGNWKSVRKHLCAYMESQDLPIEKVDDTFISGFQDYLLSAKTKHGKPMSRNAALSYFIKLKVVFKIAVYKKFLKSNPATIVKCIKPEEKERDHVTLEEIKRLINTPCSRPELKTAYLWGCLTGMRSSDIKALQWEQITHTQDSGYQVTFTQKKTKAAEVLPISSDAYKLIGSFEHRQGKVFKDLIITDYTNKILRKWFSDASINRHLTFHSSRHSFASILINSKAADIYTVSKLLGHKRLATTEIYAHVMHQSKIDAVKKLTLL
jgi:integrase